MFSKIVDCVLYSVVLDDDVAPREVTMHRTGQHWRTGRARRSHRPRRQGHGVPLHRDDHAAEPAGQHPHVDQAAAGRRRARVLLRARADHRTVVPVVSIDRNGDAGHKTPLRYARDEDGRAAAGCVAEALPPRPPFCPSAATAAHPTRTRPRSARLCRPTSRRRRAALRTSVRRCARRVRASAGHLYRVPRADMQLVPFECAVLLSTAT